MPNMSGIVALSGLIWLAPKSRHVVTSRVLQMEPIDFHQNTQIERGYQAAISVSACLENIERWEKMIFLYIFGRNFLIFTKPKYT